MINRTAVGEMMSQHNENGHAQNTKANDKKFTLTAKALNT
jgi:hypothetical protein